MPGWVFTRYFYFCRAGVLPSSGFALMDFNRSGFSRVDFMRLSSARRDSYVAGFSFNWVFIRLAFQTAVFFFYMGFYKADIFTLLGFDKAKFCTFGFLYS